jgi:signal transduction histidine kinase
VSRFTAVRGKGKFSLLIGATLLFVAVAVALLLHFRNPSRLATPREGDLSGQDAWTAFGGTWTAGAQEIENTSEERGAKLISRLNSGQDYQVQADIQIAEPYGEAGLVLRSNGQQEGVDAYHGYFAGVRTMDSSLEFGRADFGWHPLVRISLLPNPGLQGWIHLRVVAVGCTFGILVTLPDGTSRAVTTRDDHCILSGSFGLRSSLSSAKWKNLDVKSASASDLNAIQDQSQGSEKLSVAYPFVVEHAQQYESSMRAEARKRVLQAGVKPILSFLMTPGTYKNVTIQGTVISAPPFTDIQDDSGALIVPHVDPKVKLKLGDVVEARGTVISERFRSRLEDAEVRVLWSDMPVPPLAVTTSQLTDGHYRGRSIEVVATLVSMTSKPAGYELILKDGDLTFRGIGSPNFQLNLANVEIGSRLRLRGMASAAPEFTNDVFPFVIFIAQADVVSGPPWWSPRHITLLLLACISLLLCVQFAVHRLQQWHLQSVLKEREQLAFEMHDTLAQSFTGLAYQLNAASLEWRGEGQIKAHVHNALQMVQLSHKEAGRTIAALRPQFRDAATILSALKESAERVIDGGPLEITTCLTGRNTRLPVQVTDALFRIGQEAISNAIQHAACTTLTIDLVLSNRQAELRIHDNGRGFEASAEQRGLGIAGMHSRAEKIRAHFEIVTNPGDGTTITVGAPLPHRWWPGEYTA